MTKTLSIRLSDVDRATLEQAAGGKGVSSLVRDLAEREARRLRTDAVRAETERFMQDVNSDPALRADLESLGTPPGEPLDSEAWWPAR
jgi:hypothetical protein